MEKLIKDGKQGDIDIYLSDIELLEDEYIKGLPDESLIYKANCFNGLLLKIYQTVLINLLPKTYRKDYDLLDSIFFRVYIPLCYKYNMSPTILQFCSLLVNIDNANISDIKNGVFRNGYAVNDKHATQITKRWYAVCESGLLSRAISENSIGAIFSLKSLYSYQETAPQAIETKPDLDVVDISAITDKYKGSPPPKFEPIE